MKGRKRREDEKKRQLPRQNLVLGIMIGLLLGLVACSGPLVPPPLPGEPLPGTYGEAVRIVEGTVENAGALGSDHIWAWTIEGKTVASVIAGGPLRPDGSFYLVLPETVAHENLYPLRDMCRRGLVFSSPYVGGLLVPLLADTVGTNVLHTTSSRAWHSPKKGDRASIRIYVDRDTTLTGRCTRGEYRGLSAALTLREGWNLALVEITSTGLFSWALEIRSELPPDDARWYAFP
ncbi:MAG: hypothetical protein JSV66_18375 [Trueperaceae bacterium]|nr:MAG: hypothetical protein JSV66_18375 [Trueperaceae bacterium]